MSKHRKLRRAGALWRLLVHRHENDGPYSDMAYNVQSDRIPPSGDGPHSKTTVLDRTEFDELVVGSFAHIEQKDTGTWWANFCGVTLWVRADRDGKPLSISVYGPLDYGVPVEGCKYSLSWDGEEFRDRTYPPERPEVPATNPTKE